MSAQNDRAVIAWQTPPLWMLHLSGMVQKMQGAPEGRPVEEWPSSDQLPPEGQASLISHWYSPGGGTQVFTSRSSGEVMLTVSVSSLAGGGAKQRQDDDVVQDMMMKGWKPTY